MPRKKKVVKPEQKTSESLGYAGSVQVQLIRGNKVIKTINTKNSGRLALFSFLANALIGRLEPAGAPRFIILGFTEGDDSVGQQISTNAIPYSSVSLETSTVEGEVSASAVFKFLIPFSTVSAGNQINLIRLYSQNSVSWSNHIASFKIDGSPIVSDGKSNILITWTMKLSNQLSN
jgi:hypothetical protein